MGVFSIENPVFVAYAVAASLMILKLMGQGWVTVYRMMKSEAGLLNPEDLLPGPANRHPDPSQLQLSEYVERSRRVHRNDIENILAFLAAGWVFVAVRPPLMLTVVLMSIFVVSRLAHTLAYMTRQRHEVRATLFSLGSIVVVVMAVYVLVAVLLR
ncbi:MAG: MAPEG family protein [Rhizobiales bacterium]|jgi:glutathione S-transferase|nr:MAPEG family protein [Hyphomicrobiales bacterium]